MKDKSPLTPQRRAVPLIEAAKLCGISREQFYRWIRQGKFSEPLKQGRRSYVMSTEIDDYLDKLERSAR